LINIQSIIYVINYLVKTVKNENYLFQINFKPKFELNCFNFLILYHNFINNFEILQIIILID